MRDRGGRRAVEHFMQDYFRHATRVGELTRIFLTELEARTPRRRRPVRVFRRKKGARRLQGRAGPADVADPTPSLPTS
jgi:[protein-PII] uridylyltransferase